MFVLRIARRQAIPLFFRVSGAARPTLKYLSSHVVSPSGILELETNLALSGYLSNAFPHNALPRHVIILTHHVGFLSHLAFMSALFHTTVVLSFSFIFPIPSPVELYFIFLCSRSIILLLSQLSPCSQGNWVCPSINLHNLQHDTIISRRPYET